MLVGIKELTFLQEEYFKLGEELRSNKDDPGKFYQFLNSVYIAHTKEKLRRKNCTNKIIYLWTLDSPFQYFIKYSPDTLNYLFDKSLMKCMPGQMQVCLHLEKRFAFFIYKIYIHI